MIISNTEVTSFSTCKRAHFYRFGMQVEPKEHVISRALFRGIVGHRVWEAYYRALQAGDDPLDAGQVQVKKELDLVLKTNPESYDMVEIIVEVSKLLDAYAEVYSNDSLEILEVETAFSTSITEGIDYGLKLDVLARYTKGEYKGDLVVVDHKFLYNFKTAREIDLDGQLPKYVKTVSANGYTVTKGMFNQIRYRSLKNNKPEDLFKREPIKVEPYETERIWQEQLTVANEIQRYKAMPLEEWDRQATRNMSPYICRSCYFATICKIQLGGRSIDQALVMDYQPNTYGYTSLVED